MLDEKSLDPVVVLVFDGCFNVRKSVNDIEMWISIYTLYKTKVGEKGVHLPTYLLRVACGSGID